jgi:hypothetical protein
MTSSNFFNLPEIKISILVFSTFPPILNFYFFSKKTLGGMMPGLYPCYRRQRVMGRYPLEVKCLGQERDHWTSFIMRRTVRPAPPPHILMA